MYSPGEWSKEAVMAMIDEYQKHVHLYDQKSQLYYNRNARKRALLEIQNKVEPHRPQTTEHDVYKKIQTLRTQYGQEITKMKKSLHLEEEYKYRPKLWWFEHLSFLKPYMKTRSQNSWSSNHGSDSEEIAEIQVTTLPAETSTKLPKRKRANDSDHSEITVVQKSDPNDSSKEKYVIYEENVTEESTNELNQQSEIIVEPYQVPKDTKRHDEIGKFVAAQMATITDDLLFYNTQHEILTIINRAQIKQLEKNLSGTSRMYNIIETAE